MSEVESGGAAKDSGRLVLRAEVHSPDSMAVGPLDVDRFVVIESQLEGWTGYARIEATKLAGPAGRLSIAEAFGRMVARGHFGGCGVSLGLWLILPEAQGGEPQVLRRWPSVVTRLTATAERGGETFVHLHFSDLVTFLSPRPVWGVFKDCSLAEAVGGAISLVLNGDGKPTTAPTCPTGLPPISLVEQIRDTLDLPYVVAAGDTLGVWLARLLGRVGVRMEMLGVEGGGVEACLKDGPPAGSPVSLPLGRGRPSALNAVMRGTHMKAIGGDRDAVLDTPSTGQPMRVDGVGSVGTLVTGAGTEFEEAVFRAKLRDQFEAVSMVEVSVVTGQSGILPGRRVRFDRPVSGTTTWQAGLTQHGFVDGAYLNTLFLVKDGAAWRPRTPDSRGATMVTGLVDDGTSKPGEVVHRDRLGRIPVALHVELAVPEATGTPPPPRKGGSLLLPMMDPIAGGMHGFLSEPRQGDRCRLAVNSPIDVEVVGFLYDDHRPIAENVSDGSMGIIVGREPEAWSGLLFRPDMEDDKDSRGDAAGDAADG